MAKPTSSNSDDLAMAQGAELAEAERRRYMSTRELEVFYREEHRTHGRVVVGTAMIEQLIRIYVLERCGLARELDLAIEWGASDSPTACTVTWTQILDTEDKREIR